MNNVITYDPRWRGLDSNPYLAKEWQRYVIGPSHPRQRNVSRAPVFPGVYFLFDGGALKYVGQSTSIRGRLLQHRRNGRPFTAYSSLQVAPDLLVPVEAAYLNALRPIGNATIEPPKFIQHWHLFDAIRALWKCSASDGERAEFLRQNAERRAAKLLFGKEKS